MCKPDGYSIPHAWLRTLALLSIPLDAAEVFSSCHTWTDNWRAQGLCCSTYDIEDVNDEQDCRTERGQTTLFTQVGSVKREGLVMLPPKCSNCVPLNMGTAKRCKENPLGNTSRTDVRDSNDTAAMLCSLCRWMVEQSIYWIIEQPLNSWFFKLPVVEKMLADCGAMRVSFAMELFGASSKKPTELWGTAPWLQFIANVPKPISKGKRTVLAERRGKWVSGKRKEMKASQAYPPAFGARMLKLHMLFMAPLTMLALYAAEVPNDIKQTVVSFVFGQGAGHRAWRVVRKSKGFGESSTSRQLRLPAIFNPRNRVQAATAAPTPSSASGAALPESSIATQPYPAPELVGDDDTTTIDDEIQAAQDIPENALVLAVSPADDQLQQLKELEADVPRLRRQYAFLEELGLA